MMKLFLRDLPADTSPEDVRRFLARAVAPRWYLPLRESGTIEGVRILTIRHADNGATMRHGIAEVLPQRVGGLAILKLNGRRLKGSVIEVRRWYDRSPARDRRQTLTRTEPGAESSAERAPSERRRRDRRGSEILAVESASAHPGDREMVDPSSFARVRLPA